MNGKELNDLITIYTGADDVIFTPAERVSIGNTVLVKLSGAVRRRNEDKFTLPAFANLKSSDEADYDSDTVVSRREHPLDVTTKQFSSAAAMFDGENWVKLIEDASLKDYIGYPEEWIVSHFTNDENEAKFCKVRDSIWIFSGPITAVTGGLKIMMTLQAAKISINTLTDESADLSVDPSDTTFGLPEELHELWARAISIRWKLTRDKPIALTPLEQNYGADLKVELENLTNPNLSRSINGVLPDDRRLQ